MRTTPHTLRSRLLVAMGLGMVTPLSTLACGGDASDGSDGGAAAGGAGSGGSSGAEAAAGAAGSQSVSGGTGGSVIDGGATGGSSGTNFCEPWPQCATVRRPFLVGADMRSSDVEERDDWAADISPIRIEHDRTREFLARSWLKDALEEHASVAAFARFSMLLLSVGAPPDLVIASQRASIDEVAHARACFALARRYGVGSVGPAPLHVADSLSALSLAELAALTVAEGCVGETLGALLAAEQLEGATDSDVRRILQRIAKDEARHAEVAWKVVAWAMRRGGAKVEAAMLDAFHEAVDELLRMPVVDYGVDIDVWHAHGRVTCTEARELARNGVEHVVWPCLQALLGRSVASPVTRTYNGPLGP